MLDVEGLELSAEDKEILAHPLVGGVILFTRNYYDTAQLNALTRSMQTAARDQLLIAVDHEGGRVQRFRDGFTAIPPMGRLLNLCGNDVDKASVLAEACGIVMAYELLSQNIDLSFAPVLDLCGISEVIGDRSFSANIQEVVVLSTALMRGMKSIGMATTGKHFPGHGSVKADSHIDMPVDERSFGELSETDLAVFNQVNQTGLLDAVMPAHVIYSEVDKHPAGFSEKWIQSILRQQMKFNGIIFSDDLSMQAATVAGNASDRTVAALSAGCDMALVCNSRESAVEVFDNLPNAFYQDTRVSSLRACEKFNREKHSAKYNKAGALVNTYIQEMV